MTFNLRFWHVARKYAVAVASCQRLDLNSETVLSTSVSLISIKVWQQLIIRYCSVLWSTPKLWLWWAAAQMALLPDHCCDRCCFRPSLALFLCVSGCRDVPYLCISMWHTYIDHDAIKVLFTTLNATWRGLALIEPNLPPDTVCRRQLRVWCDPFSSTLTFTAAQPAGLLLNVDWLAALRRLPEWSTGGVYGENHSLFYSLPLQLHRSICHTNTNTLPL